MNLASASLRELRVAFGVDARSFLEQFDSALRGEAQTPDPRVGAAAGEALRGLRIGAEFLGLRSLSQLCREVERELLAPPGAPPESAQAGAMRVRQLAQALHQALGDVLALAPQDPSPAGLPQQHRRGSHEQQQPEQPQPEQQQPERTQRLQARGVQQPGVPLDRLGEPRVDEQGSARLDESVTGQPRAPIEGLKVEDSGAAAGSLEPPPGVEPPRQPTAVQEEVPGELAEPVSRLDASRDLLATAESIEPAAAQHMAADEVVAMADEPVAGELSAGEFVAGEFAAGDLTAGEVGPEEVALQPLEVPHVAADAFMVEEFVVEEAVVEEAVVEQPVPEEFVAEVPVAQQPVVVQAVVEQPVAEEVVPDEFVVEVPVAEQSVVVQAVAEQSVAEQSVAEEVVPDEFVVEEAVAEEPVVEHPVAEEFVVEQPVAEEFVARQPVAEEFMVEEFVAQEAVAQQPVAEEFVPEQPVPEQPVAEEPVAEEPVAEEPVAEEPVAEQPVPEEPVPEEPVPEEPVAEEPEAEEAVLHDAVAGEAGGDAVACGPHPAAGSAAEPARAGLSPAARELVAGENREAASRTPARQEELAMRSQVEEFAPVPDEAVPGEPVQRVLEQPLPAQPGEPGTRLPATTGAGGGPVAPPAGAPESGRACRWDLADASRLLHDAVAPLQGSLQRTQDLLLDQQQGWQRLREELLQALAAAAPSQLAAAVAPPREQPATAQAVDAQGADAQREADAPPAWDGVLQVHPARLGEWTVALPSQCVLGQLRQPRGLRLPRGESLVLSELGALPDVGLEAPWQLEPDPLGADEYLLVGDRQAAYALRVQSCLEPRALHFWSLPVVLGAPLGVAAAAVLDRPALAAGASPRASDLVLLLDPGFIAAQHAAAREAAAGEGAVQADAAREVPA